MLIISGRKETQCALEAFGRAKMSLSSPISTKGSSLCSWMAATSVLLPALECTVDDDDGSDRIAQFLYAFRLPGNALSQLAIGAS